MQNGVAYLFPNSHTIIHFFYDGHLPFSRVPEEKHEFVVLKVPITMTVAGLMQQLGVPGSDRDRFGVTECIDVGNGTWTKGTTYILSQDKSQKTLKAIGWDDSRGTTSKPIWLAVYDKDRHGSA